MVDAHEASLCASLDQMPHERGRVLTPIAMTSLLVAVQKERSMVVEMFSKSKTIVHALRNQPELPIVVESDVEPTLTGAVNVLPLSKKARKARSYLRSWQSDVTLEWTQLRRLWIGPPNWLSEIFHRLQVAGGSSPTPTSYAIPD